MGFADWCKSNGGDLSSLVDRFVADPKLARFDRLSFLLAQEMFTWARGAPEPSPDQLLSWGTAWVLRTDATLQVHEARMIAIDAFAEIGKGHHAVAQSADALAHEAGVCAGQMFAQRFGRQPSDAKERLILYGLFLEFSFAGMSALITGAQK